MGGIAKKLKIGTKIILHSLRNKDEWNGDIAHIIGEKVIKNGVIRWPIQLMLPPQEKATVKQENFHSLDREKPKDMRIGTKVRLHGLESKKDWNGKAAKIIGEKKIKNGVDRWPIELLGSSNDRAFVKRINFKISDMDQVSNLRIIPLNA